VPLELGTTSEASSSTLGDIPEEERMATPATARPEYQRIAEAFVHPLKLRILTVMAEKPPPRAAPEAPQPGWSPNTLHMAVGEPLGNVSYHVRQLEKASLIELVATKQRRGAIEHYYTLA
jgi:DNA-binding transcriptional ArsR family regulator